MHVIPQNLHRARRLEREPPREHPVEDHAERVDVARGSDRLAGGLLGGHVRGRPDERPLLGERVGAAHPRDSEVGDLRVAFLVEDDVHRLQVAVHEAAVVGVREACGDLARDRLCAHVVERLTAGQSILERPSRQVLEHHVRSAALVAVVEQPADVRVRERRDGTRLAVETLGVGARSEELDRDAAVELQVVGDPDLGHSARAEPLLETVPAADRLCHV